MCTLYIEVLSYTFYKHLIYLIPNYNACKAGLSQLTLLIIAPGVRLLMAPGAGEQKDIQKKIRNSHHCSLLSQFSVTNACLQFISYYSVDINTLF